MPTGISALPCSHEFCRVGVRSPARLSSPWRLISGTVTAERSEHVGFVPDENVRCWRAITSGGDRHDVTPPKKPALHYPQAIITLTT